MQLMQAKDFITNVSATFATAQAQVVPNEEDPSRPKYTIRGVRPRAIPVDTRGRPYMRCLWQTPAAATNGTQPNGTPGRGPRLSECDMSVARAEEMWEHIITVHLGISKDAETGEFSLEDAESGKKYSCHWGGCHNPSAQNQTDVKVVARHVQTHLPDTSSQGTQRRLHNVTTDVLQTRPFPSHSMSGKGFLNTQVDERGDAGGLPLASVLVLRNLARQMGKIDVANALLAGGKKTDCWVEKCFAPVRERLFFVMAWNVSLREYLPALEGLVDRGIGWDDADGATV
jgi:chromatin structure-remodeling complex subunit RSC9